MPLDETKAGSAKALEGVRVLDIATYVASPYCATLMGEFGAEVIKVELPKTGDSARRLGSMAECGDTLVWLSEARNKQSVTLDIRTAEGKELLKRLVAESDVLCENFRPGTLEKWGLGWDELKAVNPKLVMLRVSGYGQTGPYSHKPGFGRVGNAFGGMSFLSGDPDRPPSIPGSVTLADYMAGMYGAIGVLIALRHAERSGAGQVVDVALYEPIFRCLDELVPAYEKFGYIRQRNGPAAFNLAPHSHYPTKDDRWVAIACTNDKIFARLAHLMGKPELVEPDHKLATNAGRLENRGETDGTVTMWTREHTQAEVVELCDGAAVPCGIVASVEEIFADPHYKARGNIVKKGSDRQPEIALPNVVPRLTVTPGSIESLGPALGEHTKAIFQGLLGMSDAELEALQEKGVI